MIKEILQKKYKIRYVEEMKDEKTFKLISFLFNRQNHLKWNNEILYMFSVSHYRKRNFSDIEMFRFWVDEKTFNMIKEKKYLTKKDLIDVCSIEDLHELHNCFNSIY